MTNVISTRFFKYNKDNFTFYAEASALPHDFTMHDKETHKRRFLLQSQRTGEQIPFDVVTNEHYGEVTSWMALPDVDDRKHMNLKVMIFND